MEHDSSRDDDQREDTIEEGGAVEESADEDSILSEDSFHPLDRYTHTAHR